MGERKCRCKNSDGLEGVESRERVEREMGGRRG